MVAALLFIRDDEALTVADDELFNIIHALPKIELHRHLEGSVRLETLIAIAGEAGIEMPEYDAEMLRPFVQMMPGEPRNMKHFLAKFSTLRQFFRSAEIIRRVTHEVIADAAADNVKYLELRFTPRALTNVSGHSYDEAIDWVCSAATEAASTCGIEVRLIVSINRHESPSIGDEVLAAAIRHRDRGIVALDLAGNEAEFPMEPFVDFFARVRDEGFAITIHAGEWGGSDNVRYAVEKLGAARIGHGVRVFGNQRLMAMLAERGIALEICPTSNVHSGIVSEWSVHPLPRLFHSHVKTTVNTDDPLVSNLSLSEELYRCVVEMGLTLDEVKQQVMNAAQSAFLPDGERATLVKKFEGWLA
jgi:adenosine deaminase